MIKKSFLTTFFTLIILVLPTTQTSANTLFTDVPEDYWAKEAIHEFYSKGYVNGYEDNSFGVNHVLSRSHAAVIFTNVLGLDSSNEDKVTDYFSDIQPSTLYAGEIAAVGEAGIFRGNGGKFQPDQILTREQMATTLVNALDLQSSGQKVNVNLSNVSATHQKNVQILADLGITTQLKDFRPKEPITRAQFVVFFAKALEYYDEVKPISAEKVMQSALNKEAGITSFDFQNHLVLELKTPDFSIPEIGIQQQLSVHGNKKVEVDIAGTYQKDPLLVKATVRLFKDNTELPLLIPVEMTADKIRIYNESKVVPVDSDVDNNKFVEITLKELEEHNKEKELDVDFHTELATVLHELITANIGTDGFAMIKGQTFNNMPADVNAQNFIRYNLTDTSAKNEKEKALAEKVLPKLFQLLDSPVYAEAYAALPNTKKVWDFDALLKPIDHVGVRNLNMTHVINTEGYIGYQTTDMLLDLMLDKSQYRLQLNFEQQRTNIK